MTVKYTKDWMTWAVYKKKKYAQDRIKMMREGKDPVLRPGSYYLHAEYNPYLQVWAVVLKVRKLE